MGRERARRAESENFMAGEKRKRASDGSEEGRRRPGELERSLAGPTARREHIVRVLFFIFYEAFELKPAFLYRSTKTRKNAGEAGKTGNGGSRAETKRTE